MTQDILAPRAHFQSFCMRYAEYISKSTSRNREKKLLKIKKMSQIPCGGTTPFLLAEEKIRLTAS